MEQIPQGQGQTGGKIKLLGQPTVDLKQLEAFVECLTHQHEALRMITEAACKMFLDKQTHIDLLADGHYNDMALIELLRVQRYYRTRADHLQRAAALAEGSEPCG